MYELAKKARSGMKSKAERLAGEKDRKTDSSDWSPAPELNADVKTGMRPVSRRAYKKGGKVAGCAPKGRADRKPRKAGGKVEAKGEQPLVDRYVNRDLKKANEYRDGKKHVGALKHGGRAKKADGGPADLPIKKGSTPKDFWTYQSGSETPSSPPAGSKMSKSEWESLSPGMRREIHRSFLKLPTKANGGRAAKANGGSMTMEEMIKKNPAPAKKPLGLDKVPLPPRRPENLTPAANNKIKPDQTKYMTGDVITGPPKKVRKDGGRANHSDVKEDKALIKKMVKPSAMKEGRAKKEEGGGIDPRLGIVSPKALNFAQNVVTPGLKKGGRAKKEVGGPAIEAGKAAMAAMSNPPPVGPNPSASNVPPVSSGLAPQPKGDYVKPPAYDPDKYKSTTGSKAANFLKKVRNYDKTEPVKNGGRIAKAKGGSFWGSPEFQSAFKQARKSFLAGEGPKNFEFKGKSYSTDLMKIPTPPERQRPVQEKKITVEFGPPKGQMPKTDQMGNPNPGMKKGGRIAKQIGGALGRAANALGRGMAPAAMGSAMRPQMPLQAMMGRPPIGANPAMMGRGPAPQAMANAQGRPFQPGGKFAPPPITTMPVNPVPAPIDYIDMGEYLGGTQIMTPTPVDTTQPRTYGGGTMGSGTFARGGRIARALGGETSHKSKGKSKSKSGKTHINIVIATGKDQQQQMPPAPMGGPMPPPPPPPAPPMGGPMAGPMGAPPMPPPAMGGGMPPMPPDMMGGAPMPRKAGGRVTKVAKSYKDMTAGAGSGEGRLQKTDIAKRAPHKAGGKVYRSYKDMDAGAGSGKGRMEKTEIQKRKK